MTTMIVSGTILFELKKTADPSIMSTARLHFCEPVGGASKKAESLGSIIWGDRIFDSAYEVYMLEK